MSEHTPGPWKIHRGFSDWGMPSQHDIYAGDEELIAGVPSMTPYCMGASAKDRNYAATQWANAQLISAAPDLLFAAEQALNSCVDLLQTAAGNDLQAAIDKAKGVQKMDITPSGS